LQVTHQVIVVNDGSTDDTEAILARFPLIKVINYPHNKGKGYALQRGFELAVREGFQYAITLDSDGQHFASDIPAFLEKNKTFPDSLIVGSRTLPEEKLRQGSGFANRFSNFWFRFISGVSLPDTQSGFRLYPLDKIKMIRFFTHKYEFELEVLIRAAWRGIHIMDIPIDVYYPEKKERISHFRPFHDFVRISMLNMICFFIAVLYVKPLHFCRQLRKDNIREFLKKNVLHSGDSITKLTLSVMFGVFMGIIPIWGYQLISAITLAYLLRLNMVMVILAANISIFPFTAIILYLSYITGGFILAADNQVAFSSHITLAWFRDNFFQYVVGAMTFAVIAAIFFGLITYVLLKVLRRRPAILD